jgi:hypothetical protein
MCFNGSVSKNKATVLKILPGLCLLDLVAGTEDSASAYRIRDMRHFLSLRDLIVGSSQLGIRIIKACSDFRMRLNQIL